MPGGDPEPGSAGRPQGLDEGLLPGRRQALGQEPARSPRPSAPRARWPAAPATADPCCRSPGTAADRNENHCSNSSPNQNTGMATPSGGSDNSSCRSHRDLVDAAMTAISVPSIRANNRATEASLIVSGNAAAMLPVTDFPPCMDLPKSTWTAAAEPLVRYCTITGRSNPYSCAQLRHLRRVDRGPVAAGAQHGDDGVARQQVQDDEADGERGPDHEHRLPHPPEQIPTQVLSLLHPGVVEHQLGFRIQPQPV